MRLVASLWDISGSEISDLIPSRGFHWLTSGSVVAANLLTAERQCPTSSKGIRAGSLARADAHHCLPLKHHSSLFRNSHIFPHTYSYTSISTDLQLQFYYSPGTTTHREIRIWTGIDHQSHPRELDPVVPSNRFRSFGQRISTSPRTTSTRLVLAEQASQAPGSIFPFNLILLENPES